MYEREVDVFDEVHAGFGGLHVLGGEAGLRERFGERNEAQTISKVLGQIVDSNFLRNVTISPEGEGLTRRGEVSTGTQNEDATFGMRVSYLNLNLFPCAILRSHTRCNVKARSS